MQSEEILEELAEQTDGIRELWGATFEVLEHYGAIADTRLTAFSSEKMGAVAMKVVGYAPNADEFSVRVYRRDKHLFHHAVTNWADATF